MHGEPVAFADQQAVHAFASDCQILAGALAEQNIRSILRILDRLARGVPRSASRSGQLATFVIVASLCHQVASRFDIPPTRFTPNSDPSDFSRTLRDLSSTVAAGSLSAPFPQPASADERVKQMCEEMRRSIAHPLGMAELAARVGLSASRAQRLFRLHMRVSAGRYSLELRLQHAADALQSPTRRVSEAAYGAGFAGLPQFDRAFRRRFGMSPTRYRAVVSRRGGSKGDRGSQLLS